MAICGFSLILKTNVMSLKPHQDPRKSTRLQAYDYAQNGAYFVTLCAQNRLCLFGDIESSEMRPNDSGCMVLTWLEELQAKFPNIDLDAYVLMPNHLHAIIVLYGAEIPLGAPMCAP